MGNTNLTQLSNINLKMAHSTFYESTLRRKPNYERLQQALTSLILDEKVSQQFNMIFLKDLTKS